MIVVADTGPVNYLLQIGQVEVLPALYGGVILPDAVLRELLEDGAPPLVREWAGALPMWVSTYEPDRMISDDVSGLHAGEAAAIRTALEVSATVVLLDDRRARNVARSRGLNVTGTLGVLRSAHLASLVDGREAFDLLCQRTNFYRNAGLRQMFFESLG